MANESLGSSFHVRTLSDMNVHVDIPEFRTRIRSEFLYDMDPAYEGQDEFCTVYAVSSYKGHYLTFKVLLENGSMFDYIPIHALTHFPSYPNRLSLEELMFGKTCPDFSISVTTHKILKSAATKRACWFPKSKTWMIIDNYICSVDWFLDNQNGHLVVLSNGQFALVPNHKMLVLGDVKADLELLPYKKLRQEWKP